MVSRREQPELIIPDIGWDVISSRLDLNWKARENPHISIMAKTRVGKSYLIRHGLLPLCRADRVLIIDVKHNDPTLEGLGKPVRELPSKMRMRESWIRKSRPMDHWFRLQPVKGPQNRLVARGQVQRALDRVLHEGDWVVVFDELRAVTDPAHPGLNLKPYYEEFILRGGSNGIATVSASQEPRWCPGCFYTQSNAYFMSRLEDKRSQQRLSEVGSADQLIPYVQTIPRRYWLYMDDYSDTGDRFWGRSIIRG